MAPKKTNIKIKRSKINLYNKKKSKAKRALKIVLTIVIICGLGVLGYGLGKPLIKYLSGDRPEESDTSAILSSMINSELLANSTSESTESTTSTDTSKPAPNPQISEKIFYLSDSAAASESALTAELAQAKNAGCSVVAVTLKNTTGYLLYKSNIANVKDTEVVSGTLTAQQIASLISKEGLVPAARINTLMDMISPPYVDGSYRIAESQGGGSWHDNRPEKGGKIWLSPFKTQTATYIENITAELSAAGFKHIICANTRYPAFHSVDITTYLSDLPLTDSAKRAQALWNVINAAKTSAEKNGAQMWLEMSASSIVAQSRDCTDAEPVFDKTQLKNVRIIINYDLTGTTGTSANSTTSTANTSSSSSTTSATSTASSSSTDGATATSSTSVLANTAGGTSSTSATNSTSTPTASGASNAYTRAKDFAVKAKSLLSGANFAVRLPPSLTGAELADVTKALTEEDITILSI